MSAGPCTTLYLLLLARTQPRLTWRRKLPPACGFTASDLDFRVKLNATLLQEMER